MIGMKFEASTKFVRQKNYLGTLAISVVPPEIPAFHLLRSPRLEASTIKQTDLSPHGFLRPGHHRGVNVLKSTGSGPKAETDIRLKGRKCWITLACMLFCLFTVVGFV